MCFSNLPIEFDEKGDPYLAEAAEAVDRPGEQSDDEPASDEDDVTVAGDPEGVYEAVVASLPDETRDRVEDDRGRRESPDADTRPVEGD